MHSSCCCGVHAGWLPARDGARFSSIIRVHICNFSGAALLVHPSREGTNKSFNVLDSLLARKIEKVPFRDFRGELFMKYSDLKLPVRDDATSWPVRVYTRKSAPGPDSASNSACIVPCASRHWTAIVRLGLLSHPWVSVACTYVSAFDIFGLCFAFSFFSVVRLLYLSCLSRVCYTLGRHERRGLSFTLLLFVVDPSGYRAVLILCHASK